MSAQMRGFGALLALALGTAGCVLLVASPPEGLGSECHFSGENTSACGRCVTEKCVESLNACCGDRTCDDTMVLLDSCSADTFQCTTLIDPDLAASNAGAELATCISKKCRVACSEEGNAASLDGGGDGSDGKEHVTRCTQYDDHCSCSIPSSSSSYDEPNATTCGTATYPNALCCADERWPLTSTTCECSQVSCAKTVSGCECSTGTGGTLTTCGDPGAYFHCCLNSSGTVCECGSAKPCPSYETEVESCTVDSVGCSSTRVSVSACALYK